MVLFHGGCHGCNMQHAKGLGYCTKCCYFEANWNLPDLNNNTIKQEKKMTRIRNLAKTLALIKL